MVDILLNKFTDIHVSDINEINKLLVKNFRMMVVLIEEHDNFKLRDDMPPLWSWENNDDPWARYEIEKLKGPRYDFEVNEETGRLIRGKNGWPKIKFRSLPE